MNQAFTGYTSWLGFHGFAKAKLAPMSDDHDLRPVPSEVSELTHSTQAFQGVYHPKVDRNQ